MGNELSLEEIQKVSLEICKKIDSICEHQQLRYYLYGGSLLGAVRHKGFIPWDDDIDIVMPRPDYERLIAYIQEHEKELYPLKLLNIHENPDYPYMISRISHDDYYLEMENENSCGMGIFIDVYPWDGVGQSESEIRRRKRKASHYSSLCYLSTRKKCIKENTKSRTKLFLKPFAFFFSKIMGKRFFMRNLNKMAPLYEYDKSEYVGCLVWGCDGVRGIFPKTWMEPFVKLPFEDTSFRAPKEYEKALTRLYHNYMELPPVEDRFPHHCYKAFKKQTASDICAGNNV